MSTKRKLLVALAVFLLVFGGFFFWIWRGTPAKHTTDELSGHDPVLVEPKPEQIPSVAIAKPIGWEPGQTPVAAKGLTVTRFAEGLDHPRVIYTLPNGDVLAAEADAPKGNMGSGIVGMVAQWLMKKAGANQGSPDTLILLRDSNADGKADQKYTLRTGNGLVSPSGLAWRDDVLYVANHDMVQAFPYKLGETALNSTPSKVMDLPGGGNHWMRNILLSQDGKQLYVAVGSATNIAEKGMELEKGRAAIWQKTFAAKGYPRQYANGLRNPNGLAWNPATGELWVTVNERDQLGPDLVPDYLTNVPIGSHYGWPWVWWIPMTMIASWPSRPTILMITSASPNSPWARTPRRWGWCSSPEVSGWVRSFPAVPSLLATDRGTAPHLRAMTWSMWRSTSSAIRWASQYRC